MMCYIVKKILIIKKLPLTQSVFLSNNIAKMKNIAKQYSQTNSQNLYPTKKKDHV